jgi:hypothetical protein
MDIIKSLVIKWIEAATTKERVRDYVVFWPMIAWGMLIGLAEAALLGRGGCTFEWVEGILVPVADIAPLMVSGGVALGMIFCAIYSLHVIVLTLYKRIQGLTSAEQLHNEKLVECEQILIVLSMGITSVFAIPYQTDLPGCLWGGGCKNAGEAYLVTGIMAGYLSVVIAEITKKLKRLAKMAEASEEEKVLAWTGAPTKKTDNFEEEKTE